MLHAGGKIDSETVERSLAFVKENQVELKSPSAQPAEEKRVEEEAPASKRKHSECNGNGDLEEELKEPKAKKLRQVSCIILYCRIY